MRQIDFNWVKKEEERTSDKELSDEDEQHRRRRPGQLKNIKNQLDETSKAYIKNILLKYLEY